MLARECELGMLARVRLGFQVGFQPGFQLESQDNPSEILVSYDPRKSVIPTRGDPCREGRSAWLATRLLASY